MKHLDFLLISAVLIILPRTSHAFFRVNPQNISVVRNISCQTGDHDSLESNFQLCAIRLYNNTGTISSSYSVFNGLRYTNTFRHFIQKYCHLWPISNETILDVGFDTCLSNPVFAQYETVQLCICATDNCNANWSSCKNSSGLNYNISRLPDFMPYLNETINCDDATDPSNICREHHFVPALICQEYVKNNSVMCAITLAGIDTTKTSLIEENYEAYLDAKIYQIRSAFMIDLHLSNETDSSVYYTYSHADNNTIKDCACTRSFCNQNYDICEVSSFSPDATNTSVAFTTTVATSQTSATTMATSQESTTTMATSQASTTTMATSQASTTAVATPQTSAATMATSQASTVTMATSQAPTTPVATSAVSSTTERSSGTSEHGPNTSATAGIACGIILSAVIFTSEIILLKFFCNGAGASGAERSVAYRV